MACSPKVDQPSQHLPHPALGIDYGDARIGVAATDPLGILAHPVETVPNQPHHLTPAIERIQAIASARQVQVIVVGLPFNADGTAGPAVEKVKHFAAQLASHLTTTPIVFIDEYLTTVAASQKLHDAGKNTRKQKKIIDQAAAIEILNNWMAQPSSFLPQ